ncbi:hypothetical protein [Massilia sp. S19_KUP03_FR1]|uniref:hypothetical protein n=1 Tax=Massilia sp. S19_KUP03_FR1 TaxID=3025503 RepID=UPI002FCDE0EB
MREVSGTLSMLGSGKTIGNQVGKSFVHFSSIEIGNEVLIKVRTAQALGDYISRGLNSPEPVTLYLVGKLIIAVKLGSGKLYYWKRSYALPIFCLLTLPLWGAGFVLALFSIGELKQILSYQPRFASMGGVALKS